MSRTLGLIVLASALATVPATAQQADLPYGNLVAAAGEQIANQCVRLLDAPSSDNELAERAAEMSKAVFCDCMPPAIADLGRARAPDTLIDGDEFGALVLREFDVCGARAVRDTTRRDCAKFTPANAPPTYCACFSAAVDALSDEEIVADSIASRDNLEQRADARRNQTPEPALQITLLARIDNECLQPQPER
ncbi:MAG TPA: hypothetical protein VNA66_11240 [Gammaproteobacteria bacterium]|nr:hypothetical protein [Gammaproteobacteria bacterium]